MGAAEAGYVGSFFFLCMRLRRAGCGSFCFAVGKSDHFLYFQNESFETPPSFVIPLLPCSVYQDTGLSYT